MILFLLFELKTIIAYLLEIIVYPEVIESCKSPKQLKEVDLNGFSVDVVVNKLKRSDAGVPLRIKS